MAAEVSKTEAGKTTGSKTTASKNDADKAVVDKTAKARKKTAKDDTDAINKTGRNARNALGRNSRVITNKLADKAKEGDASCARLLVKLADAGEKYKKKKGPSPTVALEKEPPWDGGRKKNKEVALAATAE